MDTNTCGEKERLSLAYKNYREVPSKYVKKYASNLKEIDLTANKLRDIRFLASFQSLRTLILDHNPIDSHVKFPLLPQLETLWVNHTKISNLSIFIAAVGKGCPSLRYLSMLNTEAAPSFFNGGSPQDYIDFRLYVVSQLRSLEFLDYLQITYEERKEANRVYKHPKRKRRQKFKYDTTGEETEKQTDSATLNSTKEINHRLDETKEHLVQSNGVEGIAGRFADVVHQLARMQDSSPAANAPDI
ncbi:PREDICTED: uncharacterized protein LOC106821142 isoform X1 [Priapulus caudatus]|uniref:Uncharacterized protein LOC106821142 isoform X1 n=1 Tax=Priapulus caudatus TaxID=37621 RepID=A0ABM1FA43_PRICU|nr:PREDICTED: uncharacterized protein LOC106821142 isoform X1 [Priapulus caudatus]